MLSSSLSGKVLCHGWDQVGHCKLRANHSNIKVTIQSQSNKKEIEMKVQCLTRCLLDEGGVPSELCKEMI